MVVQSLAPVRQSLSNGTNSPNIFGCEPKVYCKQFLIALPIPVAMKQMDLWKLILFELFLSRKSRYIKIKAY
jgi:hypothetical protein